MSTELTVVEKQKKEMQSLIDTVVMHQPALKDRLTLAAVWQYMQMPDNAFGWSASGEMPKQMKLMNIAAHLQQGAQVGYGHIYFLGTKLYQSAEFIRAKAASDPEFKIVGEAKFLPHTPEERAMFGLKEGDISCKCLMDIEYKGSKFQGQGDGIIGKDELDYRSASGKTKAGLDTAKNRAMSLKTRAYRDFLNRYYPTQGIPVAPENVDHDDYVDVAFTEQVKAVDQVSTPEQREVVREKMTAQASEKVVDDNRDKLNELLSKLRGEAKAKKMTAKEICDALQIGSVKDLEKMNTKDLSDKLEELADLIAAKKEDVEVKAEAPKEDKLLIATLKNFEQTIGSVEGMGGLPMKILGFNHLNVFDMKDHKEIKKHVATLEKWIAGNVKQEPKAEGKIAEVLDEEDFPFDSPVAEETKVCDAVSLAYLNKILEAPNLKDPKTKELLTELAKCSLKEGDSNLIKDAVREAHLHQKYLLLNSLVSSRK